MKKKRLLTALIAVFLLTLPLAAFSACAPKDDDNNFAAADKVTVSFEAFSIGNGYIVSPVSVTLTDETYAEMADMFQKTDVAVMKKEFNSVYLVSYVANKAGYTITESGGYLSALNGFTNSDQISADLKAKLGQVDQPVINEGSGDKLGSGDYTAWAGWMFSLNGELPSDSLAQYVPTNGDVIRMQFSLYMGMDIGYPSYDGSAPFFSPDAKNEITVLLAYADHYDLSEDKAYTDAVALMNKLSYTKKEIATAYHNLLNAMLA